MSPFQCLSLSDRLATSHLLLFLPLCRLQRQEEREAKKKAYELARLERFKEELRKVCIEGELRACDGEVVLLGVCQFLVNLLVVPVCACLVLGLCAQLVVFSLVYLTL